MDQPATPPTEAAPDPTQTTLDAGSSADGGVADLVEDVSIDGMCGVY